MLDPIIGILSRKEGLNAAARLVAETIATKIPLAFLWLDLDRFQQVNQSFGHSGGDKVISCIAQRIRSAISSRNEVARMGSDEFVCMVPGLERSGAEQLARELLRSIDQPLSINDLLFRPSVSIGVAMHSHDEDSLALLERSDRAMIEAKRRGGNCVVTSGEDLHLGRLGILLAREELETESDLHTALETGGLQLNYQPIIGRSGHIEACEALMRCSANNRQIPPGKFIPVAEKTGLIVRLGEWSLLQGALFAARLHKQGTPTKVAINVSRLQLNSSKFIHAVHGALICADVAPALIELELTESLFMDVSETVQNNLHAARSMGMGLAVDDFGTGYSSLSTLKDLPATKLKLDRAFVCVLPEDRRALIVVKSMTQLARELGMTVVAEGVETQEQMDALSEAGVDAFQGFFLARPMAEEALLHWLAQRDRI